VARRNDRAGETYILADGGAGRMRRFSPFDEAEWIVALALEGSGEPGRGGRIRLACRIEPAWLEELFPDRILAEETFGFDERTEQVTGMRRKRFGTLVLEEQIHLAPDAAAAAEELARAAEARLERAIDRKEKEVQAFLGRLHFLSEAMPELGLPVMDDAGWKAMLPSICAGRRSFECAQIGARRFGPLGGSAGQSAKRTRRFLPGALLRFGQCSATVTSGFVRSSFRRSILSPPQYSRYRRHAAHHSPAPDSRLPAGVPGRQRIRPELRGDRRALQL